MVAKIDVKSPEKEERGGTNTKEVKALVEMYRSIFEHFKTNKRVVADFKLRQESKNSRLTSRGYPPPAADKEEMNNLTKKLVSFSSKASASFSRRSSMCWVKRLDLAVESP